MVNSQRVHARELISVLGRQLSTDEKRAVVMLDNVGQRDWPGYRATDGETFEDIESAAYYQLKIIKKDEKRQHAIDNW